jgi:subtilisin family serine protease
LGSLAPGLAAAEAPEHLELPALGRRAEGLAPTAISAKVAAALRVAPQARAASSTALQPLEPPRTPDGRLAVTVTLAGSAAGDIQPLADAGLEVTRRSVDSQVVEGAIAPEDVERLAALGIVRAVEPIDRGVARAGAATTEGDAGSLAPAVRAQGFDGTGVVVGVISDGIDSLAVSQATGDLGPVVVPGDARCSRGSGDEGTAILEIVHDIAPGATLLFSGGLGSSLQFIDAVNCLIAAGANVIVDDLGFFSEPYFEDGPIAQAVRGAVMSDVSYHSSAGNEAQEHLEVDYRQSPSTTYLDFLGGPVDNTDSMVVPPGASMTCVLQWADRFGASSNDYDLYLLDSSLQVVASSENVQSGTQNPVEIAGVYNPAPYSQVVNVAINKYSGVARRLEMFCLGASGLEYSTPGGSIIGHPALAEVVTVAAIDQADVGRDTIESFSSRGPAVVQFPFPLSRAKPDISALDGVSISNAGGFPMCPPSCRFFGTSAAAPHSAAVAALLLNKNPALSPAAIRSALQNSATDVGTPGRDDLSGFGRLNAFVAATLVAGATPTSTTSPTTTSTLPAVTTTTSPYPTPTTSTTVPPSPCASPCADDGDACTDEECDPTSGCRSVPRPGFDGLQCFVRSTRDTSGSCASDEIAPATARLTARLSRQALAQIIRAEGTSGRTQWKSLKKAAGLLRQMEKGLAKAITKGQLRGTCAEALHAALGRSQARLSVLLQ